MEADRLDPVEQADVLALGQFPEVDPVPGLAVREAVPEPTTVSGDGLDRVQAQGTSFAAVRKAATICTAASDEGDIENDSAITDPS